MPLVPATVVGVLAANLAANTFKGVSTPQLALGISNGLIQYITSGIVVATVDVGTAGVGKGTGVGLVLTPPAIAGLMGPALLGASIKGIAAPLLLSAISLSISQVLATVLINTAHPSVGVGTGVVTPIPNPGVSVPAFIASFVSAGMKGIFSAPLATAIANGLDAALPSAKGAVIISGTPSTVPSSGVGTGNLL